ncbi:MAG: pyridoxamine 5'-phosphate oxidase family protein [Acidimicrobiales bacterium]|nr:pyridoxamine 5'-phosphate oxidase family protein [Acidimicrobiales bacterium]
MGKSRRERIRMDEDELAAFVEEQKSLQVACHDRDGSIHLSTLWFAMVDSRFAFGTYTKSQKIVNLRRDNRITVLLEDGHEYDQLRGMMVKGRAVLHAQDSDDGVAQVRRVALAVMSRNEPGIPEEHFEAVVDLWAAKRTVVMVEPEQIITWDHTKLNGTY